MNVQVNQDELYQLLREWASGKGPQTYTDLSTAYQAKTGDWVEPHGGWDHPLGDLNKRLAKSGAPPLSALVIVHGKNEPGNGFWGSAPTVPTRPADDISRITIWATICKGVQDHKWPSKLP